MSIDPWFSEELNHATDSFGSNLWEDIVVHMDRFFVQS